MNLWQRVFGNPKSTMTALGIASVGLIPFVQAYPTAKWLAASAAAIAAITKLLSLDSK